MSTLSMVHFSTQNLTALAVRAEPEPARQEMQSDAPMGMKRSWRCVHMEGEHRVQVCQDAGTSRKCTELHPLPTKQPTVFCSN